MRSKADASGGDARRDLGFLTNPKRFNVALTRAQSLLIVVGNPALLSLDANWKLFIDYVVMNKGYRGISHAGFDRYVIMIFVLCAQNGLGYYLLSGGMIVI